MSELYREIEEDVRREQAEQLWRRFGKLAVVISISVVLGTALGVVYQHYRDGRNAAYAARFIDGIDRLNREDYKGAVDVFGKLAEDGNASYYAMSMLRKGFAQKASGDAAGAAKTYKELSEHDPVFGALAGLLNADSKTPVVPDRDSPFYYTQSEWKGWQLVEQGKTDEAVALFVQVIKDKQAPPTMRQRLTEVVRHIDASKLPAGQVIHD